MKVFDPTLTWGEFVKLSDQQRVEYLDLLIVFWRAKDQREADRMYSQDHQEEAREGWAP